MGGEHKDRRAGSAQSPLRLTAALGPALALVLSVGGCGEGTVGPCAGQDCPTAPGCQGDDIVTCDPGHVCTERVCEGVGWICGVDAKGNYDWLRSRAPCDDGNSCTTGDLCVAGQCVGTPKECNTPPPRACADASNLKTYKSKGTCTDSTCVYNMTQVKCPKGCQGGQCVGSPCIGVTCDNPPSSCFKKPGTCLVGTCSYEKETIGQSCDPKDKCIPSATCDGQGNCTGAKVSCSRANTINGICVAGVCQGYQCTTGWGNCNSTWNDGCELQLNTTTNCGSCGRICSGGANGSPVCANGQCTFNCITPYKDCDANPSNGCEVPVGVANACSKSGLTNTSSPPTGCGTAYCGSSTSTKATNFGMWYCYFCSSCHLFSNGYAWCLFGSGNSGKFSPDRCVSCCPSSYLDMVCSP